MKQKINKLVSELEKRENFVEDIKMISIEEDTCP